MIDALADLDGRVVYFPVRHHSPACARRVRELIETVKPAAVLIEGPSDFNDRIDELFLPHRLPIAIYSYARVSDGGRRGAYHPFCVYSPEWQALQAARASCALVRFIDLPWFDIAQIDAVANRYSDQHLRRGEYVRRLCKQVGVESFDDLWDTFFELDGELDLPEFVRRVHHFCVHSRMLDEHVSLSDRRREAFMAGQVQAMLSETPGRIVVVTGGYHSAAIHGRLAGTVSAETDEVTENPAEAHAGEHGIALTPYSYERLDSLRGYEAGMPNPGYYHEVWHQRGAGSHRRLLGRVAELLRTRGQPISAADLIAAEGAAQGLAQLRGHPQVWRRDLVDGIIGALIKDEQVLGIAHPLLEAVHEVFRGGERGQLASNASLPPLVHDMRALLHAHGLEAEQKPRERELNLDVETDRTRSAILHRLTILGIAGFAQTGGSDLVARTDLAKVWEQWRIQWSPDLEATSIEAARYGPTLADAAAARLGERSNAVERNANQAALLLLDAALAELTHLADTFLERIASLIGSDPDFVSVTSALGHLLYLLVHDQVLKTAGRADLGRLVHETFTRGLWLLEGLGQGEGRDRERLTGVQALLEAFERCGDALALNRDEFVAVLQRVQASKHQAAVIRGAASGVLWTIGECNADEVQAQLLLFADPDHLGDFLAGLFCLAREASQRHRDLVLSIDRVLDAFADDEFLAALPSLRLAFTYFTPREKHHMALTLCEALGLKPQQSLTRVEVTPEAAARALAFEGRLFEAAKRFGLRGGNL
jgi:Family of unknown function (DUF5682)